MKLSCTISLIQKSTWCLFQLPPATRKYTQVSKDLCIKSDVNTLRHCGEMACVEEHLHTFGKSDINCNVRIAHTEHDGTGTPTAREGWDVTGF